jgi:hypothetical protein
MIAEYRRRPGLPFAACAFGSRKDQKWRASPQNPSVPIKSLSTIPFRRRRMCPSPLRPIRHSSRPRRTEGLGRHAAVMNKGARFTPRCGKTLRCRSEEKRGAPRFRVWHRTRDGKECSGCMSVIERRKIIDFLIVVLNTRKNNESYRIGTVSSSDHFTTGHCF